MRRTACTARPAISRTRPRTSPGWRRKVLAVRTIPTCKTETAPSGAFLVSASQRSPHGALLTADRKTLPATPDPEPFLPVDVARHRQVHQLIEHIAMD